MRILSGCLVAILLFCSTACTPEPEEFGTTLTDSLMIEIMVDIHLINARSELGYGVNELPLDSLIRRHDLSRKEYDAQVAFYTEHPDTYLAILNQVVERIGQEARLFSSY